MTPAETRSHAIRVVNQAIIGLLTTVDADSQPHSRWMGSATLEGGLSRLYTLGARGSRKVAQVRQNPRVCWVFTSGHYEEIVTLYGRAQIIESPLVVQSVWDRLMDFARAYCMNGMGDDESMEFLVIQTDVERAEFISPKRHVYQAQNVDVPPAARV